MKLQFSRQAAANVQQTKLQVDIFNLPPEFPPNRIHSAKNYALLDKKFSNKIKIFQQSSDSPKFRRWQLPAHAPLLPTQTRRWSYCL